MGWWNTGPCSDPDGPFDQEQGTWRSIHLDNLPQRASQDVEMRRTLSAIAARGGAAAGELMVQADPITVHVPNMPILSADLV